MTKLRKWMYLIIVVLWILFFYVWNNYTSNIDMLIVESIIFTGAIFGIFKTYLYIYKCEKKHWLIHSFKTANSQDGSTSSSKRYKFLIDNVKYSMPGTLSVWLNYKVWDSILLYISDTEKKIAMPCSAIIQIWLTSIFFIALSIILLFQA